MKGVRLTLCVLALALLAPRSGRAQDPDSEPVKITVARDTIKPGETTPISIDLNFRTRPPLRGGATVVRARFTINVTRGSVTHTNITYGEFESSIGYYFIEPNLDDFTRAVSHIDAIFEAPAGAGEVLITVEGQHSDFTYRGVARVNVLAGADTAIGDPAAAPPFTPTPGAVNPGSSIIAVAAGVAGILGGLVLINHIVKRKRQPVAETKSKPEPGKPEKPAPPPASKTEVHTPPSGCSLLVAARSHQYRGNATDVIQLVVIAIPATGWQAEMLKVQVTPDAQGYGNVTDDDSEPWFDGTTPLGSAYKYLKVQAPWEWVDTIVGFTAQVSARLTSLVSAAPAKPWQGAGTLTPRIQMLGANPKVFVTANPEEITANGRNGTAPEGTLWLFYEPAPAETVTMSNIVGLIDGNEWGQRGAPTWTPPFLLEDPEYLEEIALRIDCQWISGVLYDRAPGEKNEAIRAEPCAVFLRGCTAMQMPETSFFAPMPKTPLFATGKIVDVSGAGVNPYHNFCVSRDRVSVTCEIRDLSQGPKDKNGYGCTRPPGLLFDIPPNGSRRDDFAAAARAAVARVRPVNTPVDVDSDGSFYTSNLPVEDFEVVQEESGPPGAHTQRVDRKKPRLLLWRYQPRPDSDPIHGAPVVYTLIVNDGFGGRVELQGICRVALGSLVLETGGKDFRFYEHRPCSFEVEYRPGAYGYNPRIESGSKWQLTWEFARVNDKGDATEFLGAVRTEHGVAERTFHLIVGHTPRDRAIYIDRKNGEVAYRRENQNGDGGFPAIGWRKVDEDDRERSVEIRRKWHEATFEPENALNWLPVPGASGQGPHPWRDRTLPMAIRLEMRSAEGHLFATSDRWITDEQGIRTPPELVWNDHRFRYVLMALRLLLRDEGNRAFASRRYRLTVGSKTSSGETNELGMLETWLPADCDTATLELLPKVGSGEPGCVFSLKFGQLDAADEARGAQARLNNLGLFAGEKADGVRADSLTRAVQRFQALQKLDVTGQVDDDTKKRLEAIHAIGPD